MSTVEELVNRFSEKFEHDAAQLVREKRGAEASLAFVNAAHAALGAFMPERAGDLFVKAGDVDPAPHLHFEAAVEAYTYPDARTPYLKLATTYGKAIVMAHVRASWASAADLWEDLGKIREENGETSLAFDAFAWAARCYKEAKMFEQAFDMHTECGRIAFRVGDYADAARVYKEGHKILCLSYGMSRPFHGGNHLGPLTIVRAALCHMAAREWPEARAVLDSPEDPGRGWGRSSLRATLKQICDEFQLKKFDVARELIKKVELPWNMTAEEKRVFSELGKDAPAKA